MKVFLPIAAACAALMLSSCNQNQTGASSQAPAAAPAAPTESVAEKNKEIVIRYYNALAKGDTATLRELGRPDYKQHNPNFGDTLQGLIDAIAARPPRPADAPPVADLEFVRVIADDQYVVTVRKMNPPAARPEGYPPYPADAVRANVDIFRVEDGKVAEHWDYTEVFPREGAANPPKNSNGYF